MRPSDHIEEALFDAVIGMSNPEERAAFLSRLGESDPPLRARLEALLSAASGASNGLLSAVSDETLDSEATGTEMRSRNRIGVDERELGRYTVMEKLGEGGCGVVYVAQQHSPVTRKVALKVIKPGMDSRSVLARFEMERQALALMDHPNIAKVFDAGATDTGRPFFVMELVTGLRITEFCDEHRFSVEQRIRLFIQVCEAIQHAHQKGIIHRDIKPSNILVASADGYAVPKVIDFGIAKAMDSSLGDGSQFTLAHQVIGTPAYMSPEQADAGPHGIDTRSDIYSLGVLLYELLTGRPPFDPRELANLGVEGLRRVLCERDPERPTTRVSSLSKEERKRIANQRSCDPVRLPRQVGGDLDWIVMKCLEKDRARRYETANGLAADLRRHLNSEVVVARPPSAAYRFQRMVQRNRGPVTAFAVILVLLIVGGSMSFSLYLRASSALARTRAAEAEQARLRKIAEEESASARAARDAVGRSLYAADMLLAYQASEEGNLGRARSLLRPYIPGTGDTDQRGFEWRYLWNITGGDQRATLNDHSEIVSAVAWSPDQRWLASGSSGSAVHIRSATNGQTVARFRDFKRIVTGLSFSHDSRTLAVSSDDGFVRLLDVPTGGLQWTLTNPGPRAVFSPKEPLLAVGVGGNTWAESDGEVMLWDTSARQPRGNLPESGDRAVFSTDGRLLATANFRENVSVFDVASRRRVHRLPHIKRALGLAFTPDAQRLAISTMQGEILVWDLQTDSVQRLRDPATGDYSVDFITGISIAADGRTLAASRQLHQIELWDLPTAKRTARLAGHESEVWAVAFSPDGKTLASASYDRTVRLWDTVRRPRWKELKDVPLSRGRTAYYPFFTPDSKYIAVMRQGWAIDLMDARTLQRVHLLPDGNLPIGVSADGLLVSMSVDGKQILRWDLKQGRYVGNTFLKPENQAHVYGEEMPRDAKSIAFLHAQDAVEILDTSSGNVLRSAMLPFATRIIRVSPDGEWLMLGGSSGDLAVLDYATLKVRWQSKPHGNAVVAGSFAKNGRCLASGSWDGKIHLWNPTTGERLGSLNGHKAGVLEVAFSSDGKTMATSSDDRTVKLWHVETRRELATVPMPMAIYFLRFAPDDSQLVVADGLPGSPIHLWQAPFDAK